MKILVGLSNGLRSENMPYQMFIVDVDAIKPSKQEWMEVDPATLNSCDNVRVNLGKYKSITQNPVEYLEAEFDVSQLVDVSLNNVTYQITHLYTDEKNNIVLYRTIDSTGKIEMHHVSEFMYKKKFSIYGEDINELPSHVKILPVKDAYLWWKQKDAVKEENRATRFVYENFDTNKDMPVQLLYHYLIGVKEFQLGYHTVTELYEKENQKLHEYFLFKGTANIKLKESLPVDEKKVEEVAFFGNKDPYPDTQKLGYYGATMSLICDQKHYPTFDVYSRPTSEINFDQEGIEVTFDITDGGIEIYNKCEEAKCISDHWRLNENCNFFGASLLNLLPQKLNELSKVFQNEKERIDFGHWSSMNTHDWFQVMAFALSAQSYSPELRVKLNDILKDYQTVLTTKLNDMIEKISAKDALVVMKWAKENVEKVLQNISFLKDGGKLQKLTISNEQMQNLFTYKRNTFDLPDWLQIYSSKTIESLGGEAYLNQVIRVRGEESAELFLSIWAEKVESEQKYISSERKTEGNIAVEQLETTDTKDGK